VGGFFSIILRCVIVLFLGSRLTQIFNHYNPDLNSVKEIRADVIKIDHDYKKMNLLHFHTLKKQIDGSALFLNRPGLDRYLNIYFLEEHLDWF
jgi:hypothetical protein